MDNKVDRLTVIAILNMMRERAEFYKEKGRHSCCIAIEIMIDDIRYAMLEEESE